MRRLLAAATVAVAVASTAAGQAPQPASGSTPPPAHAQPAPRGGNAKAIEKAKALGKREVEKIAPKLGKAEKIVRKQAEPIVDKVVDFAAEKVGIEPRR